MHNAFLYTIGKFCALRSFNSLNITACKFLATSLAGRSKKKLFFDPFGIIINHTLDIQIYATIQQKSSSTSKAPPLLRR